LKRMKASPSKWFVVLFLLFQSFPFFWADWESFPQESASCRHPQLAYEFKLYKILQAGGLHFLL
jgi:hypothetical protein